MSKPFVEKYGRIIVSDILTLFVGRRIAKGNTRDVYEFGLDHECVVKIEARGACGGAAPFGNITEHAVWGESTDHEWRRWLAPVVFLSPFGTTLIMRRTEPLPISQRPELVPNFLSDLKMENWGLYQGRPVVHDYGNHNIYSLARDAHKLVPARWHDGKGGSMPLAPRDYEI